MARLPTGPTCYVTLPSWPVKAQADADEALRGAEAVARELGWRVVPSPLLARPMAGHGAWQDPAVRLADLRTALRHDVVWGAKGGYGCIQLLPGLLRLTARRRPAFIGFSDNTVMHALWWRQGWEEAFYGRVPHRLGSSRHGRSFLPLARGEGLHLDASEQPVVQALADGEAQGPLFVACLRVLAGLAGTPLQPDLRGALLAIEDVDEKPYNVDFALSQLHLAGALTGVRGIVGGFFTHTEKSDYSGPAMAEVLARWAARLRVPAITRLPFGHLDDHLVLPTGRRARLSVRRGRWSLELVARSRPPWLP
jgi:muramoyltetrapeptide carboxypeptidase